MVFCRIQTPIKDILYKEFPRGEVFSKLEFPNLALIGGELFSRGVFCSIQTIIKNVKKGKKLSFYRIPEELREVRHTKTIY